MNILQKYDTILNINVIEHVHDAFLFLSNIYESLRPGGLLIFHERWHENVDYAKCTPFGDFHLHPIRVKKAVLDHFLSHFEKPIYFNNNPTPEMISRASSLCPGDSIETGLYVAAYKKKG